MKLIAFLGYGLMGMAVLVCFILGVFWPPILLAFLGYDTPSAALLSFIAWTGFIMGLAYYSDTHQ